MFRDARMKNNTSSKKTKSGRRALTASVLLALLFQLGGCADEPANPLRENALRENASRENASRENASREGSTVKQLTEGQVKGIASPYDEAIRVYRGLPYARHLKSLTGGAA